MLCRTLREAWRVPRPSGATVRPEEEKVRALHGLVSELWGLLGRHGGADGTAVWEWGFLERVSTGRYLLQYGAVDQARMFLDTAERLV